MSVTEKYVHIWQSYLHIFSVFIWSEKTFIIWKEKNYILPIEHLVDFIDIPKLLLQD